MGAAKCSHSAYFLLSMLLITNTKYHYQYHVASISNMGMIVFLVF